MPQPKARTLPGQPPVATITEAQVAGRGRAQTIAPLTIKVYEFKLQ